MTDVKKLQTRIALKYDTYANWALDNEATQAAKTNANLVLLKGEIGICEIPSGNSNATTAPTVLFKVGDGTTPFKALKWASALAADVYSWAKASDVTIVYNEDGTKGIKFIDGAVDAEGNKIDKVVPINFATPEEVAAAVKVVADDLDALTSRVVAVEGSIGTGGQVATDIADLQTRMDTAEGDIGTLESTKLDASVFTAFNNGEAKSVSAIESAYKAYADQAEADAKSYADGIVASEKSDRESKEAALGGRIDAIVAADTGAIAVAKAEAISAAADDATSKANAAEAAAKSHAETKASEAQTAAEKTASDALTAAVQTLNAKDAELVAKDAALEASIGENKTAIEKEVTDRGTAITNAVNDVTSAYTTAIGTAKTELEGKITAEENARKGAIDTLTQTVNTNAGTVTSEIDRVEGLIEDEAKARDDADKALDERLVEVEAFFKTTDGETLDTALDTLKEIQDYLNGEGSATDGIIGRVAAAETAIENLEGRMDTAEDDIEALEGRATAVEGRADALEDAVDALEAITGGFVEGETNGAIKNAIEAAHGLAQTAFNNAATAQAAAEAADAKAQTAQNEVDTLEGVVEALDGEVDAIDQRVAAVEGVLNGTNNDGLVKDVADLKTASATHATTTYVDETFVDKTTYAADKAATEQAIGNVYTKTEADGLFGAKTAVEKNASDIGVNAAAISANAGDIAANTAAIGTEKSRAEGEEAKIRGEFAAADTLINEKFGASYDKDNTVAKAISDAQTAAQNYADGAVDTFATAQAKVDGDQDAAIAAVSGRVDALEARFPDWFVIDCGTSTTVIDETK